MKRINFLLIGLLLTASVFLTQEASAQAPPQRISYQTVLRNSSNALLVSTPVGIRISVLKNSATGPAVYVETQTATTNASGLVSIKIGNGTATTGTFAGINWANASYFIKTETDPAGGTNYTITGTQEILTVPYAMYAAKSVNDSTQTAAITTMQAKINSLYALHPELNYPVGFVFCASGATQVVDVTNPTTGKTWMDRNLGATQVATSSTDAAAYGDLYQWGRGSDGHQCRYSATTSTLSSTDQPGNGNFIIAGGAFDWRSPNNGNLWQGVNGINNPCPSGYRIPTDTELNTERLSWSSYNAAGAFASPLKLTVGGKRNYSDGNIYVVGSEARYWASTNSGGFRANAFEFEFGTNNDARGLGYSVRCIKN